MSNDFDRIKSILDEASVRQDQSPDELLATLDRVLAETRERQRAAMLAKFGSQFRPAGTTDDESAQQRQFQRFQQVLTCEGYRGYIVGHDAKGRAIVNVVWEAAEYEESKLTAIPGPAILDDMRT